MSPGDRAALVLAGLALLTMPVFAAVRRARSRDPDVARRPRTALLGTWVRDWLVWAVGPLERGLLAARVSPLACNLAGVVLGALAGIAYACGALGPAGWLVLLGGLTDVLDGRIARAQGLVSEAGAFLDSGLDRFAEVFALAGLATFFASQPLRVLAVALALGGSLLVSYARARGEGLGVSYRGGLMARAERLVLVGCASLLDGAAVEALDLGPGTLVAGAMAVVAVGSLATAIHRTVAIARVLAERAGGR